jgi:hypothetical protein
MLMAPRLRSLGGKTREAVRHPVITSPALGVLYELLASG